MIQELRDMMVERLQLFEKRNKALPDKILVYRDGVSEVRRAALPYYRHLTSLVFTGPVPGRSERGIAQDPGGIQEVRYRPEEDTIPAEIDDRDLRQASPCTVLPHHVAQRRQEREYASRNGPR